MSIFTKKPRNRPIADYPGCRVDANGVVYGNTGRVLVQKLSRNNEISVVLRKDNVSKRYSVAELVAAAFLQKPTPDARLRHRNGDHTDCSLSNLTWKKGRGSPKVTPEQRNEIAVKVAGGANQKLLAASYGISPSRVNQIVREARIQQAA